MAFAAGPPSDARRGLAGRLALGLACVVLAGSASSADDDIDAAPIHYHTTPVRDAVARLQQRLDAEQERLEWSERWGWLPSLLERLGVPRSSQTLVFSKTSLQVAAIAPETPRALYFNDEVYLGWVPGGELIEASAIDPVQGPIFYSLRQTPAERPQFVRDRGRCLSCHDTARTRDVPGLLVRSVRPDRRGNVLPLGEATTSPATPFAERYGGWYVTGPLEGTFHLGNRTYADPLREPEGEDGRLSFAESSDPRLYLSAGSDVVALMVLEHQTQMHNAITRASYEARRAAAYDRLWGEMLGRPQGYVFEVSERRLDRAADELVAELLFRDEAPLPAPIDTPSEFAEAYSARRDSPLRQLDLRDRLYRLGCSPLAQSDSYTALPPEVRDRVEQRLVTILSPGPELPGYGRWSEAERAQLRSLLLPAR